MGLVVELEQGRIAPDTNVTDNDPLVTGKIALAHLEEFLIAKDRVKAKK